MDASTMKLFIPLFVNGVKLKLLSSRKWGASRGIDGEWLQGINAFQTNMKATTYELTVVVTACTSYEQGHERDMNKTWTWTRHEVPPLAEEQLTMESG